MTTETSVSETLIPASQRKPPKALMKVMNPIMRTLLRSPLHGRLSGGLLLLTFKGRKSGKQYTTPVSYQQVGNTLRLFTDSPWWKNLQGGVPVRVLLQGRERPATADVVTDADVVVQTVQEYLREHGVENARRIGLMGLDRTRQPTLAELQAVTAGRVVVQLTLRD